MDDIEVLKDKYIISKSINAVAYVVYICNPHVSIVENDEGYKLFCIERNKETEKYYDEYKNNEEIYLDIRKFSKIIKMLKRLCKEYKVE